MLSLTLVLILSAPSAYDRSRYKSPRLQVRQQSAMIVKYLKKQDPRVLQSVMKHMGWEFKQQHRRADCKKSKESRREELDKWEMDMLCKMAGIPCRQLE